MKTAAAFAPAHVSALFAVHDEHPDPLRKGSRGAGWCIDRGATATVRRGTGILQIDGVEDAATVTRRALALLDPRAAALDVDLRLDLPVGQGFGMSAAGSLAACLAATDVLGLEPEVALAATHAAEVESGTGLGDAIGSWLGGAEVRVAPGIPPHGGAVGVHATAEFLFCVMGAGIATTSIIRDAAWAARTRSLGDAAVDRILAAGQAAAWPLILAEGQAFSAALGLMPPAMTSAAARLPHGLAWGQCMLGSTLWVTGAAPALAEAAVSLRGAGTLLQAAIDANGARLVRPHARFAGPTGPATGP